MQGTWHTTSYNRKMFIGKNWSERTGFAGSFSSWVCDFRLGPLPSKPGLGLQYHVPITTSLLWLPTSIEKKHGNRTSTQSDSSHLVFFQDQQTSPKPESIPFELMEEWRKGSCRATVYLPLIKHESVYNGPSTARQCLSRGLEDQPPRYPRGQMVKGFQTSVAFHQMGWRSGLRMPEPPTFHEDHQLKPEFQYQIKTSQNRSKSHCNALHNSKMFIVVVTVLLLCASAVSLSPWSFAQVKENP